MAIMKYSERSDVLEPVRAARTVLRPASLAIIIISVSAYSAIYAEAGASVEPPDASRSLSHPDCELSDFNSVVRTDMHRLFDALVPPQEDPCFPQADPEIHGVSAAALEGLSATIHGHFESDYIVGAEFLVIKSGQTIMHEAYGWMDREELKPMDYARFISMLMNDGTCDGDRILSADAVDRILTPVSIMTSLGSETPALTGFPFTEVCYGQMSVLNVSSDGQLQVFGHSGSDGTWAWAFPEHDMMIFYFTQSRGQVTGIRLETDLDRLLVNPEYAPPPEIVEKYEPYLGTYVSESAASMGEQFTVLIHNDRLGFDIPGLIIFELQDPVAEGQRWHFQLDDQLSLQFIRNRSGDIAELRFYEPGYTHTMTKVNNQSQI